jgi:hypothetical protein
MLKRPKAHKTRKRREYRFLIDAYSPETMPASRLAEYISDLTKIFGSCDHVHLVGIENGSTVPVFLVDYEAEPKVRERLRSVKRKEGPPEAMKAWTDIDERLVEDNGTGCIKDPTRANVIAFPGRERKGALVYGPITQPAFCQGVPIMIGGKNDPVPVHLEDGNEIHIVLAKRSLAKKMAEHLFTSVIRVHGNARWTRKADGNWELHTFRVEGDFEILGSATLKDAIQRLREVPADWKKLDDPISELKKIRQGDKVN